MRPASTSEFRRAVKKASPIRLGPSQYPIAVPTTRAAITLTSRFAGKPPLTR
jgi:hypothetical protein